MDTYSQSPSLPHLEFNRKKWAALRNSVSMALTKSEIMKIKRINENLSLNEISEIYLPLSRLLDFYISANIRRQVVWAHFLSLNDRNIPYIIGISGSVAVGKSTIARVLQVLLSHWSNHRTVEVVTTDGFLYPNWILKKLDLMKKKGFPESYDTKSLVNFILKVKDSIPHVTVPVYSHLVYDIAPKEKKVISNPDVLILEGLNVLQSNRNHKHDTYHNALISDFIDFSIYVDAPENLIQSWYIDRFLKFRRHAFYDPNSYFYYYSQLSERKAIVIANQLWNEINSLNLKKNILPTRECASLILGKGTNHAVDNIRLLNQF